MPQIVKKALTHPEQLNKFIYNLIVALWPEYFKN